jgi:hypothetical protein
MDPNLRDSGSQNTEAEDRDNETQDVDGIEADPEMDVEEGAETAVAPGGLFKKNEKNTSARQRGTSSLPASRVLKIIKADEVLDFRYILHFCST